MNDETAIVGAENGGNDETDSLTSTRRSKKLNAHSLNEGEFLTIRISKMEIFPRGTELASIVHELEIAFGRKPSVAMNKSNRTIGRTLPTDKGNEKTDATRTK